MRKIKKARCNGRGLRKFKKREKRKRRRRKGKNKSRVIEEEVEGEKK